jgi:ankyrin repeat protein
MSSIKSKRKQNMVKLLDDLTLSKAVRLNDIHILRQVLRILPKQAVNEVDALKNESPLHEAVRNSSVDIIKELIKQGADPEIPTFSSNKYAKH